MNMEQEREFEVGEHMLTGVYNKCMVCLKKLKVCDIKVFILVQNFIP